MIDHENSNESSGNSVSEGCILHFQVFEVTCPKMSQQPNCLDLDIGRARHVQMSKSNCVFVTGLNVDLDRNLARALRVQQKCPNLSKFWFKFTSQSGAHLDLDQINCLLKHNRQAQFHFQQNLNCSIQKRIATQSIIFFLSSLLLPLTMRTLTTHLQIGSRSSTNSNILTESELVGKVMEKINSIGKGESSKGRIQ